MLLLACPSFPLNQVTYKKAQLQDSNGRWIPVSEPGFQRKTQAVLVAHWFLWLQKETTRKPSWMLRQTQVDALSPQCKGCQKLATSSWMKETEDQSAQSRDPKTPLSIPKSYVGNSQTSMREHPMGIAASAPPQKSASTIPGPWLHELALETGAIRPLELALAFARSNGEGGVPKMSTLGPGSHCHPDGAKQRG